MSQSDYQICERCVMDTSFDNILFDEHGICQFCTDFIVKTSFLKQPEQQLREIFDGMIQSIKEKGKGRKYDCLVGISGGVDSCYTAHLCKEHDLRPLLVHMDNGWNTDISVKNITTMIEALGFDYVSEVLDWSEFREIQLAFLKSSIVDLEMPTDIAIAACLHKIAAKFGIKYIISGGNYSGEGILPLQMGYHQYKDMKLYKHIVAKYGTVKIRTVPTMGLFGEFYFKFFKGIRMLYPLNYIGYDKDEAKKFLINHYGWQNYGGKHHESRITAFWQSYVMPEKFNMDYRRTTLASQICTNQIDRNSALALLESKPYDQSVLEEQKNYIAKKFGISVAELNEYLAHPPKTYKDFPNNAKLISKVHKIYRRLFSK